MKFNQTACRLIHHPLLIVAILALALTGCGSGSDDDATGYIKFYNAASNAPAIFMSIDEDLDDDPDDEIELTYSSVAYAQVSATNELEKGKYYVELAYQDEQSTDRSDLALIYQQQLKINKDQIKFVVLTNDIRDPNVLTYDIDIVDDDEDSDDDLFNLRLLNLSSQYDTVDLYVSKDNETFNEAELIGTVNYEELTDNLKLEQDQYIYYITLPGSTEVLYTSDDISYASVNQYIIVIRDNAGVGSSPFSIDSIGNNGVTELNDIDSESTFSFYNAIAVDELDNSLPGYQGQVDINVSLKNDNSLSISNLAEGHFSESTTTANGDYNFDGLNSDNGEIYIRKALLSLKENADNAIFLYGQKTAVDEDGDGVVDENEDGIVDAYETKIKSMAVTKNNSTSLYNHTMKLINLTDSDDFSRVTFYFVMNNESITTAENSASVLQEKTSSVSLLNNTYDVYAVAAIDGTDVILDTYYLVLDEDSEDQFVIFESDTSAASGFKMTFVDQQAAQ
ncbi:hypothetical protein [Neptunicella sp. SCSIO 80796]|uniref:hypothetical protein n=1 Tax=Neptunicella plasticusilytica TaxID=3117012 RepID=UPI003A4E2132